VLLNTHAAESPTEMKIVEQKYGLRPPRHLDALGLLTGRTVLAHCVLLNHDEIGLLAARGTAVAHCPISNLKLGAGIAPVNSMLNRGVKVMIGTDGAQSSNDLNLWPAMRMAALLQKGICNDPTLVPARQVVRMATCGAAEALGLGDKIGALEVGKRADLILLDLRQAHAIPLYDVYLHLVYSAGREDVSTVLINGRKIMHERRMLTIDELETHDRVRALSRQIHSFSRQLSP
jgi:5-methylthioadenosine/S-adenosylhomocysteine deaminase